MKGSGGDISLSVSILLGANDRGQPNVTSTGCSFNVGHLSVKLSGGARLGRLSKGHFETSHFVFFIKRLRVLWRPKIIMHAVSIWDPGKCPL